MMIARSLSLILWLLIVPFCIGLIPIKWIPGDKRNIGVVTIAGYLIMLPLCWLVTVPCILLVKYNSFLVMSGWFTALLIFAAMLGIVMTVRAMNQNRWVPLRPAPGFREKSWVEKAGWVLFFGLIAFQLYKAYTLASFDGDDAEYVAQSLVTQQSNTMYLIKPYTGGTTSLDIRHSLAVLPIWIAYIGKMTGIHTTILSHTILPFLFLPIAYTVYYEMGKHLFKNKKEYLPGFLIFIALLQMFGNVSIYTSETFLLTRTWQGKAVAAGIIIPVTIWLMLWIFDRDEENGNNNKSMAGLWVLLAFANITAGVCTSMAVFLNAILIGVTAFWMMLAERKFSILIKAGIVCIPNAVYMLLYLFLHV